MDRKELLENLEKDKSAFYIDSFGINLKVPVKRVVNKDEYIVIELNLEEPEGYGDILVNIDDVKKVIRPSNVIAKFKWCYMLNNEYGDFIGYVGAREENKELYKAMEKAIDEAMKEEI